MNSGGSIVFTLTYHFHLFSRHAAPERHIQRVDTPPTVQVNKVEESNTPALQIQRVEHNTTVPSYDVEYAKRYALVLFNTGDRQGALEEAVDLCQSLITAGFYVVMMRWTTTDDLTTKLQDLLNKYSTNFGLLFVSIMSHGRLGTIKGSGTSEIAINNLLLQLTNNLKDGTPLVSSSQQ